MRPGSRSPLEDRTAITDLGRFGLGLKTASFSQCRRLTVVTRSGGEISCAVWDLDTVAARDRWMVERPFGILPESRGPNAWMRMGPSFVWEKLDRLVEPGWRHRPAESRAAARRDRDAPRVRVSPLPLRAGRAGQGAVQMLSQRPGALSLRPLPLAPSGDAAPFRRSRFLLDGREIRIQPVTLPHHDKVSEADWKRYAGAGRVREEPGILPVPEPAGSSFTERGSGSPDSWSSPDCRACASTSPTASMPSGKSTSSKAWAQPPASGSREAAPHHRSHRRSVQEDIHGRRGARLTEDSRLPVWTRSQDKNRISYGLNLEHPLFSAFEDRLDEAAAGRVPQAGRTGRFHAARRGIVRRCRCRLRVDGETGAGPGRLRADRAGDLAPSPGDRTLE